MAGNFGTLNDGYREITEDIQNQRVTLDWQYITVLWLDSTGGKSGVLTVTIDGDDLGGNNTLNLSSETSLECSGVRPYAHITVAGFPAGSVLRVYFRS